MRMALAAVAALSLLAAPALSQDTTDGLSAEHARAQALGKRLYAHDQAAWHGTDAMFAEIGREGHPDLRGYVVDPMANGNLGLVFYAENDGGLYEFARYEVAGSKVVGGSVLEGDARVPLSPTLKRLANARQIAIEEAVKQEWGLCSKSPPNFVILPPDENDHIAVYILTSTTEAGMYPFGGHFRVDIDKDGKVVGSRRFTNSCLTMPLREGPKGEKPVGLGVSHSLDEHPTEIHYFQSYYLPAKLFVIMESGSWIIENGKFTGMMER